MQSIISKNGGVLAKYSYLADGTKNSAMGLHGKHFKMTEGAKMKNTLIIFFICSVLFAGCRQSHFVDIPRTNFSIKLCSENGRAIAIIRFNNKEPVDTLSWCTGSRNSNPSLDIYVIDNDNWIILNSYEIDPKTIEYHGHGVSIDWRDCTWSNDYQHKQTEALNYYDIVLPSLKEEDLKFQSIVRLEKHHIWFKPDYKSLPYVLYGKYEYANYKRLRDKLILKDRNLEYRLYMDNHYTYLDVKDMSGGIVDAFKWLGTPELPTSLIYQDGNYYIRSSNLRNTDRLSFMEHSGISNVYYIPAREWPKGNDNEKKDNSIHLLIYGYKLSVL